MGTHDGPSMRHSVSGRNRRTVWTITPKPFPDAHFATYPPALVEPCILAGTSEKGCCAACGAPWVRQVKASGGTLGRTWHNHTDPLGRGHRGGDHGNDAARLYMSYQRQEVGWLPSCACDADIVPCTVLDPFLGSGTMLEVAAENGRAVWIQDAGTENILVEGNIFRNQFRNGVRVETASLVGIAINHNEIINDSSADSTYDAILLRAGERAHANEINIVKGHAGIYLQNGALADDNIVRPGAATYSYRADGGTTGIICQNNYYTTTAPNNGGGGSNTFANNLLIT